MLCLTCCRSALFARCGSALPAVGPLSHPLWVRSCSFAGHVDHPSRRPGPQASPPQRRRLTFPRTNLLGLHVSRIIHRDRIHPVYFRHPLAHHHTLLSRSCSYVRRHLLVRATHAFLLNVVVPTWLCRPRVAWLWKVRGFWPDGISSWILSFALSVAKSALLPLRNMGMLCGELHSPCSATRDCHHQSSLVVPRV